MTVRKYSSRSQQTSLSSAITSTATSMTVLSGSALMGGKTLTGTQTYTVVIDPDTALEEIVDVTLYSSGNTLTISRGVDTGTPGTGVAHSAGAVVRHMAIGRDFQEANDHIENQTTAHGLTIANVLETTDTDIITGAMLQAGSVGTAKIDDAAVTAAKIGASAITTAKIADLAITEGKIADGSITSAKISNGTIVDADINASAAITATKISGTAVTQADTGTVTSTMIANGTIVDTDINASAAIDKTKISGTAITAGDTGTVTSTMIANDTIVNADINTNAAIAKTKLNLGGTITSADLVDGTIVAADIADGTITAAKMVSDPYARTNHTGSQTASTISDFDTQVRSNRLDQMAAPTGSVSANSQKITNLALASSNGDAVSVAYLESQKGIANGIAPLDSNGKVPFDHIPATAIAEVFPVASQAAMLALTAGIGDIAIRSDLNKSYILRATPASTLGNWNELLTPTDTVLAVDGQTGSVDLSGVYLNKTTGVLAGNLDANTHKVTNLGTPTSNADAATKAYVDTVAGSASAAAASAAAAATTYDNFDDRYLGSKSSAPALDNDGNAIITGAIYWNSTTNAMYAWTGTEWGSISSTAAIFRYRFNASGGETTLSGADSNGVTLSYIPGKEQVYLNGVLLVRTTDYTATSGTSITSLAALSSGDIVEIITFTSFELATAIDKTIFDAKGDLLVGVSADTPGRIAVGSNGTVLVADSSTSTGLKWSAYDPLPSQTGNTGKVLTTDGSTTSWQAGLPSQSGNTGKYLTTDGSAASWASVTTDPTPTTFLLMGA